MKCFSTFLFSILFFTSINSQTKAEYMEKKNGTVQIYYPNSKNIKTEGKVHNHLKIGLWKNFDEKGQIVSEENYSNGILDGSCTNYFSNGEIYSKGNYTNGEKTGEWQYFNSTKVLIRIDNYDGNGNKLSVQKTFYSNGKLETYSIIDAAKNKTKYTYDLNGTLVSKQTFVNDTLEGLQYGYRNPKSSSVDTLPGSVATYVHGKLEGVSKYYLNGHLTRLENYENGKSNGYTLKWDTNGIIIDSTFYKNGNKDGKAYKFENGKLKLCETYLMGRQMSPTTFYYEDGKVLSLYYFKITPFDSLVTFYPDGNRKSICAANLSTSEFYYNFWSENGVLVLSYSDILSHPVLNLQVRSEKGVLLKPKTQEYNVQVKKYIPDGFLFDEKTGNFNSAHWQENANIGAEIQVDTKPEKQAGDENPNDFFSFAEVMPTFPGDEGAFQKYLRENLKYPPIEKDAIKTGTVWVSFIVEKDGSITNIVAVKGVSAAPGLMHEAIRLISQMPKWNPAQMNGRAVRLRITQPVKFVLQNK